MSPRVIVRIAALALAALVGGCAGLDQHGDLAGRVAATPTLVVGQSWTYRGREGFRDPLVWEETHEVTAIGPGGITVRVTARGDRVSGERTESLASPGIVRVGSLMDIETRRFATPLERFRFPLATGETCNLWIDNVNETTNRAGQINRYVRVGDW
jgi:hypothetical protein